MPAFITTLGALSIIGAGLAAGIVHIMTVVRNISRELNEIKDKTNNRMCTLNRDNEEFKATVTKSLAEINSMIEDIKVSVDELKKDTAEIKKQLLIPSEKTALKIAV